LQLPCWLFVMLCVLPVSAAVACTRFPAVSADRWEQPPAVALWLLLLSFQGANLWKAVSLRCSRCRQCPCYAGNGVCHAESPSLGGLASWSPTPWPGEPPVPCSMQLQAVIPWPLLHSSWCAMWLQLVLGLVDVQADMINTWYSACSYVAVYKQWPRFYCGTLCACTVVAELANVSMRSCAGISCCQWMCYPQLPHSHWYIKQVISSGLQYTLSPLFVAAGSSHSL